MAAGRRGKNCRRNLQKEKEEDGVRGPDCAGRREKAEKIKEKRNGLD